MKINHKYYKNMYQDVYDEEDDAGFEKFQKRQRSVASPHWKSCQKQTRLLKEIFLNSHS